MSQPATDRPFPILLTFDVDGETLWESRDPSNARRPITLSQGTYGPKVGLPRILALLDKYDIKATFFVPGKTIERHWDAMREIYDRGHEIGHHSYSHRWLDDAPEAEERHELDQGFELIQKLTGQRPTGYRSPAWEFTPNTLKLMVEYGFQYSSNMFDTDKPYKHQLNGQKTNLIEFPVAWVLDDAPFFLYSVRLVGRVMLPPSSVLEHWIGEFEGMYTEGGCFTLAMHPQVIGRHSRVAMLERFIRHVRSFPNVWIGRCDEWAKRIGEDL